MRESTVSLNCFWLSRLLFVMLLLAVGGCASHSSQFAPIVAELAGHNVDAALELLDKKEPPKRDRLLWMMNRGMLLRMIGEFDASNQEFAAAKQLVWKLDALSLREQVTALAINDATRSYAGVPYEQVMLNVYSALNYLDLGQPDAARVEVLQVDLRLAELSDEEVGALFENDPLARYLSGMIFEMSGEFSDAMIAYRSAYQAYQQHGERYPIAVPRQLQIDLLRNSERIGLDDENRRYQEQFGIDSWQDVDSLQQQGELIFFFHKGLAPVKVENSATFPVAQHEQIVRVSLPEYLRRKPGFSSARLLIDGRMIETELVANIEELAVAELAENMPVIVARAIARAVVKFQTTKEVGKHNDLAGIMLNISSVLTERADTRSWLSLPAEIQLARIPLEPGEYDLEVELLDMTGRVAERLSYPTVVLQAGEKTFLSCHGIAKASLLGRRR